jgi:hypothetical protein
MAAALAILGQIAKVLFCIIVIALVSDGFSDFEVIIVSMLFFLYAYLYMTRPLS